ncbi:hypothetical protein GGI07_000185 [Coemansia sp. Benny D115]|nr:hypothetical protein GGI07_000185 [Coemansia sp. Benny D115]
MTWMLSQGPEYVRSLDSGRNSLVEQAGLGGEWIGGLAEFVWRVYEAEFIGSEDIGSAEVMARLWDAVVARPGRNDGQEGVWPDGGRAVVLASEETVKDGFRRCSDAAVQSGVFGAPTFTTDDGDLYWGNDRLLDAINHHSVRDAIGQNAGFSLRTKGANL